MIKAGKASLLTIVLVCAAVLAVGIVFLVSSSESPESVGIQFMSALAKGDVNTLTKLSDMGDATPDQVHKIWDYDVNHVAEYYQFVWRVEGSVQSDPTDAALKIQMVRNVDKPGAYEEPFEIPMIKRDGHWKVDVRAMDHEIYPGLPR